ncbi:hypothetical protein [Saccharothrix hoggarensis]|uniref:Uncharacterized protein n=1 Tax=Saccharothrix hoggarensis TaxID=913853 RepID=A0ABW3QMN1_9PSEU
MEKARTLAAELIAHHESGLVTAQELYAASPADELAAGLVVHHQAGLATARELYAVLTTGPLEPAPQASGGAVVTVEDGD